MALLWTVVADVRDRWLSDSILVATDAQIETLLSDVEDAILAEFPDMPARVASGFPQRRVARVAARVVIRHLQNPDGLRSTQEGAGPFQHGTTYGGAAPGSLNLTDADRAELSDGTTSGAFTIDTWPFGPRPTLDPSIDPHLWHGIA